jgi:hypothetical protein
MCQENQPGGRRDARAAWLRAPSKPQSYIQSDLQSKNKTYRLSASASKYPLLIRV